MYDEQLNYNQIDNPFLKCSNFISLKFIMRLLHSYTFTLKVFKHKLSLIIMNKRGLIVLSILLIIAFFPLISAQTNSNKTSLDNAHQCIEDAVADDCSKLTHEEQISVLLAKGNYKSCRAELLENSQNEECWPKGSCKVKDTSMALLALEKSGANTNKVKNWLLNQTKPASDLIWYLQIDTQSASSCDVKYDGRTYRVSVGADKKVSSSAGSCLPISENGYWLRIANNCLEKEYTISCDKDFSSTLLYKSQTSSTIHVSQNINSEVAGGESNEQVNYKCFKQGTVCNYEGSLWAVLALYKSDVDTSIYLPYLGAFIDDNPQYFPEAFLLIVTDSEDYLTSVLTDNYKGDFWNVGSYGKFYNTALALLSISGRDTPEEEKVKEYLLNGKTQNSNGCWNNVRDTGLLIYSGWPTGFSSGGSGDECDADSDCSSGEECINGQCKTSGSGSQSCTSNGKYCIPKSDCVAEGGLVFSDLECDFFSEVCCSENVELKTCLEIPGADICADNEECPGNRLNSLDLGYCCSETCTPRSEPQEYTCESSGGTCASSCLSDEEQKFGETCPSNQICCADKTKTSGSYWWIWVLLILIVLVIIAIIFRKKLSGVLFKFRSGFRKGGSPSETRPPFSPPRTGPQTFSRPIQRPSFPIHRPVSQRPPVRSQKDSEFEETLKKLRELGK